ncbi:MAG: hypothetical protein ABII23_03035, partial [bacterium]
MYSAKNRKKTSILCRIRIDTGGWMLTEILVASILFLIALFPVVRLLTGINAGVQTMKRDLQAVIIAQGIIESIQEKEWDELSVKTKEYIKIKTKITALGPETGEKSIGDYDDIDDYNDKITYTLNNGY